MRRIPEETYNFIIAFEGLRLKAYRCPAGYLTIGVGHIVKEGEPLEISINEAYDYLQSDLMFFNKKLYNLLDKKQYWLLTDNQLIALLSFIFNVGPAAFQRSTMRAKINRGEPASEVGEEFLKWVWAGGQILPGLIKRRQAERRLYES